MTSKGRRRLAKTSWGGLRYKKEARLYRSPRASADRGAPQIQGIPRAAGPSHRRVATTGAHKSPKGQPAAIAHTSDAPTRAQTRPSSPSVKGKDVADAPREGTTALRRTIRATASTPPGSHTPAKAFPQARHRLPNETRDAARADRSGGTGDGKRQPPLSLVHLFNISPERSRSTDARSQGRDAHAPVGRSARRSTATPPPTPRWGKSGPTRANDATRCVLGSRPRGQGGKASSNPIPQPLPSTHHRRWGGEERPAGRTRRAASFAMNVRPSPDAALARARRQRESTTSIQREHKTSPTRASGSGGGHSRDEVGKQSTREGSNSGPSGKPENGKKGGEKKKKEKLKKLKKKLKMKKNGKKIENTGKKKKKKEKESSPTREGAQKAAQEVRDSTGNEKQPTRRARRNWGRKSQLTRNRNATRPPDAHRKAKGGKSTSNRRGKVKKKKKKH